MRRLVRLVLSACVLASAAPSFALSKIYSPNPGKWLTVTNSITLDASVASTNSYGSSDYNHTNALDRAAFTAYLAIWSGYADRFATYWYLQPSFQIRDAALRREYDYNYAGGSWRSLSLSEIMTDVRRLGNYYSPLEVESSSYFDTFYGRPDAFAFTDTVDLSKWYKMATFDCLDFEGSVFYEHYRDYSYPFVSMAEGVCFGEYGSGRTLPDELNDFWANMPTLQERFEDIAESAFGDACTILEITNATSSVLNRKPLAATSQAMSLRDAVFFETLEEYVFYTNLNVSTFTYHCSATSDVISVRINQDGSLDVLNPPSGASCEGLEGYVATNRVETYPGEGIQNEPLRVSRCNASASASGSAPGVASVSHSESTRWILADMGVYETVSNATLYVTGRSWVEGSTAFGEWKVSCDIPLSYQTTVDSTSPIECPRTIQVPTTARASSSYSVTEPVFSSCDFSLGLNRPCGGWTYLIASCACNTNPPDVYRTISFGYQGRGEKPTKDMSRAHWAYAGYGPYYHTTNNYVALISSKRRDIHATLREQIRLNTKDAVGDFDNVDEYLRYSEAPDWIGGVNAYSASYATGESSYQITIRSVGGRYEPDMITFSGSVGITVSGSRSRPIETLHDSAGGNAVMRGRTKEILDPCAIRRVD